MVGTSNGQRQVWASPVLYLAAVQAIAAYEWLVSGLNKVLAGDFPQRLHAVLTSAVHDNPNGWDVAFLRGVVLPCCTLLGGTIECAEVLVGLVLAGGALLWLCDSHVPAAVRRLGMWASTAACLGAAVMSINFYVGLGGTFPTVSPADAANEGVSLDVVILLLMLVLGAANLALAPRRERAAKAITGSPQGLGRLN